MSGPGADVNVIGHRIRAAAHLDNLIAHVGVEPVLIALVEGSVGVVEPLNVEVLVVSGGVGDAPSGVSVMSKMGESRQTGEGDANDVERVAGDVVLVIDAGSVQPAMAVAGQYGLAGGGARAGDDPGIGAAVGFADEVQVGSGLEHLLEADVHRAVVVRAGGNDHGLARRVGREQFRRAFRSQLFDQTGAPRLALEHAHEDVTHLVDGQAMPGFPRFGVDAGDGVLHGQGRVAVDEGVDAGGVGVEHDLCAGAGSGVVGAGGIFQPVTTHLHVLAHDGLAGGLGPTAHRAAAVILHSPQTILGGDESLGEPGVVLVGSANVGDAQRVAPSGDGVVEAGKSDLTAHGRDGGQQIGGGDVGSANGGCGHVRVAPVGLQP